MTEYNRKTAVAVIAPFSDGEKEVANNDKCFYYY